MDNIYRVFINSAFSMYESYYFIGTKEQLMTLIGILYSTRLVEIKRISYVKVFKVPENTKQIKYIIRNNENISTYFCEEVQNEH